MDRKSLINQLEFAYAPLTAYEFAILKDDHLIERALEKASLYVIGQRPVITLENVMPDQNDYQLNFEIHQQGNSNILTGTIPLVQSVVGSTDQDTIAVAFNYLDKSIKQETPPFFNIHGFSFAKHTGQGNEFLIWFSPEKLLQNWWKGNIECSIQWNFRSFTKYNVHYVGKATKQGILKRLTGYSTFQDILSLQTPVTEKQLSANEIVVLPFEFQDNLQIQSFGPEADLDSMVSAFKGDNYLTKKRYL